MNAALLLYENPAGNVSALLQRVTPTNGNFSLNRFDWIDITSQRSNSLPDEFHNTPQMSGDDRNYTKTLYESGVDSTYSSPFTSGSNFSGSPIGALFFSPYDIGGRVTSTGYTIGPQGAGNFSEGMRYDFYSEMIPELTNLSADTFHFFQDPTLRSDIAIFGNRYAVWVNDNQRASPMGNIVEMPDNSFPFARLTSATSADQSATFVYHQMDGTTFTEEQWDDTQRRWLPSVNITVADL